MMQAITRPMMRRESAALYWRLQMAEFVRVGRLNAGLTQAELSEALGVDTPQFISGIETGRTSIPPEKLGRLATVLGIDPQDAAKTYLRYGNPWVYRMLWGGDEELDRELGVTPDRAGKRRGPKPL